jgi:uncharacterized membrane protein YphA (DoxX/SURF4 family)
MKYLSIASRFILGVVFIFSGFVKSVDPLGSAYKFSDYFTAFHLGFLGFLALPVAVILSSFEVVLGISLILGYRRRYMYRIVTWFMVFFTLLTLVLALFNPVSDCGCFGDAVILTNWETFLKNIVLLVCLIPLYLMKDKDEGTEIRPLAEWVVVGLLFVSVSGFSLWNHAHLPLLDFRPYDAGTIVQDEMEIPQDAPVDQYDTELIYRNKTSGKREKFTMDNYPRDTARWEFVSSESKLVRKGYEPPIHDFAIMGREGWDATDQILSDPGYSLIMISYDLARADEAALQNARDWSQLEVLAEDFSFYAVSASPSDEVDAISRTLDLGYSFYTADEIMLKTVVRSNPGYIMIRNGVIVGKWGFRDFPTVAELDPGWTELIGNAAVPLGEEAQLLMEAGAYDDFSFEVIDFDRIFTSTMCEQSGKKKEGRGVVIFILAVALVIVVSHRISPIRV